MSLILDAIKKSERERQQQEVPGLGANHAEYQTEVKGKNWWLLMIILIMVVLVVLFYADIKQSFWKEELNLELSTTTNQPLNTQSDPGVISTPVEIKKPPTEKIKVQNKSSKSMAAVKEKPSMRSSIQNNNIKKPPPTNLLGEVVPLSFEISKQLPKIIFSSHVFTGNQATSFVVLNDEMLGVGESLDDEIEILQISQDGIVINFKGQQIFIKALENSTP